MSEVINTADNSVTLTAKTNKLEEIHCNKCEDKCYLISCKCNCGNIRTLRDRNGRVREYIHGHQMKNDDVVVAVKGQNNGLWKGDDVAYSALHQWLRRHWYCEIPKLCSIYGLEKKLHLCNISKTTKNRRTYTRDFSNWFFACYSCHRKHDYTEEWGNKISESHKGHVPSWKGKHRLDSSDRYCFDCGSNTTYMKKSETGFIFLFGVL